jgi:hypothetical protein
MLGKERKQLRASQPFLQYRVAVDVGSMNLKNSLCKV